MFEQPPLLLAVGVFVLFVLVMAWAIHRGIGRVPQLHDKNLPEHVIAAKNQLSYFSVVGRDSRDGSPRTSRQTAHSASDAADGAEREGIIVDQVERLPGEAFPPEHAAERNMPG